MNKKMRILIGYDGSPCAEAALDDLNRAGLAREGKACVLSVAELWLPPQVPSAYEILGQANQVYLPYDLKQGCARGSSAMREARSLAECAASRLRTNFPGWEIAAEVASGSAAWELVLKSDEWRPDLIVVGSHGQSAISRLILGSVSQRVLTEARCSVRVARGRLDEPETPVRILVGVDGSPGSDLAVRQIASRIWPPGSEVRVISANDPLTPTFIGEFIPPVAQVIEESNQVDRHWLNKVLKLSVDILRNAELKVSSELFEGNPKRVLPSVASEWGADCIFVGSVGFSNRFERFVLGSVSAAVAARAHCSVEVVRASVKQGDNHHDRDSKYSRN